MRTLLLTLLTLVAFAANSILCRLALGHSSIDPVSFTSLRLAAGALVLVPLARGMAAASALILGGVGLAIAGRRGPERA